MLNTTRAYGGAVVAPHFLAAEAGRDVLADGGHAVEAMVAAAAMIAVAYPHMNALGGDGFWLIAPAGGDPFCVMACGGAGALAKPEFYQERGHAEVPARGALAANTVPGAVDGWRCALEAAAPWPRDDTAALPLSRLLAPAIDRARDGIAVTDSQADNTAAKLLELRNVPGFAETYLIDGEPPQPGARFTQPRLADALDRLARAGLEDFYRGELGAALAKGLAAIGSPVTADDLVGYRAEIKPPLSIGIGAGRLFNTPPPTQGLASLMILGAFERLGAAEPVGRPDGFAYVHALVEATKQAFLIRDRVLADPAAMEDDPAALLTDAALDGLAKRCDPATALPWPQPGTAGDTVWLGAIDRWGNAVSFIQSLYWEFGSGVVVGDTGVLWQNRGASFSLDPTARRVIAPGRLPFHTLNPPIARLADGRTVSYGAMGGEGQPQTQAVLLTRLLRHGRSPQQAITAPRWLLGRTWGAPSTTLKLEDRFDPGVVEALRAAGHAVELVGPFDEIMGHAGMLVRHPDGLIEGGADPRSDGCVAAV